MDRKTLIAVALPLLLAGNVASAHGVRYVNAKVMAVEPVYETVLVRRPIQSCQRRYVDRHVPRPAVAAQTAAGAVVGAAIGRQFGSGGARDFLTVVGAMAGSKVAHDRALRRHGYGATVVVQEPVEVCTTEYRRHNERRLAGYWVEYRNRGRHYRIFTHERPGRTIRVVRGS